MSGLCTGLHNGLHIPLWTPSMPRAYKVDSEKLAGWRAPLAASAAESMKSETLKVVYLPSCFNQMMGLPAGVKDLRPLVEETVELLHKAGCEVIFPEGMEKLCCGTIWESKGMPDIAERKLRETEAALVEASENGRWPILCDQSPCLHHLRTHISSLKLYEPAEFIWTFLRDRLTITRTDEPVAIHVTCSMRLMGLKDTLYNLASLCSSKVLIPEGIGCCGFAGDKGMTHPGLNDWALRKLRPQIEAAGITHGYSNSRTCEIGLSSHSGIPYISIVYLVNQHSK
jgi:D-lactate dehydrogenase